MKYIKNAKIILKDRIVEGKALAYSDKIEAITCECAIPEGAEVIDAKGAYVAPGFIDIHIHGYLGEDASDGSAEGIRKMAEGIAKNGVTSWLPTTMTVSKAELEKAFEVISSLMEESKTWNGATILGVNAEGPYINPKKKGAQAEEHILKPEASFFKKYASLIKIATLAPETDENLSCIRELARDTDILLSMGHTDATYEQAIEAIQNGVKHVTHLFNAQTALQHRNPGVVGAALSTDVTAELICDTFHIHKGLFSLVAAAKGDKLVLITDCTRGGGMPDGEYTLGGQKIYVKGIECKLEDGTIAGSVLKMNDAVYNVLNNTTLSVPQVVAAASLAPAKAIGVDKTKGSIEVGKDADLIIADENFRIKKTIIGGEIRYEA
ncbi:MAG: N-acetylglucosamine-6-phosphate deacetylase [Clostridia bacterium]|nr:N-acetylglucosamine-6-phosphate deacetylase [Clostridia bacterium]